MRQARRIAASDHQYYLMLLPVLAFYAIFRYWPMYGVLIAFKEFNIFKGVLGSEWVGLAYFREVVAAGKTHTSVVRREGRTQEGRRVAADVGETGVPVTRGGRPVRAASAMPAISSASS